MGSKRRKAGRAAGPAAVVPAVAAVVASPAGEAGQVQSSFRGKAAVLVALALALLYGWLVYLSSAGSVWWWVDVIDHVRVFGLDDAYRYFLAKGAWTDIDLYNWNYILPLPLAADGVLASVSGDSLVFLRAAHALALLASLAVVHRALLALRVEAWIALLSVLILGLVPLYFFVGISFYGEAWLAVVVSVMVFALATERRRFFLVAASLMPLVRPEGVYFLAPIAAWLALRRDVRGLALLVWPGVAYGLWLLASLDRPSDYVVWRKEMRDLLSVMMDFQLSSLRDPLGFFSTYSLLWLLPALAGLALPGRVRALWPVWAGGVLWGVFVALSTWLKIAENEQRYMVSVLPLLAVGWANSADQLYRFAGRNGQAILGRVALGLLAMTAVAGNLMQTTPLEEYLSTLVARGHVSYTLADGFLRQTEGHAANRQAAADLLHFIGNESHRTAIDTVLVASDGADVFYSLDPKQLGRHITVAYMPSGGYAATLMEAGKPIFAMFPDGRRYARYRLGLPTWRRRTWRSMSGSCRRVSSRAGSLARSRSTW